MICEPLSPLGDIRAIFSISAISPLGPKIYTGCSGFSGVLEIYRRVVAATLRPPLAGFSDSAEGRAAASTAPGYCSMRPAPAPPQRIGPRWRHPSVFRHGMEKQIPDFPPALRQKMPLLRSITPDFPLAALIVAAETLFRCHFLRRNLVASVLPSRRPAPSVFWCLLAFLRYFWAMPALLT